MGGRRQACELTGAGAWRFVVWRTRRRDAQGCFKIWRRVSEGHASARTK